MIKRMLFISGLMAGLVLLMVGCGGGADGAARQEQVSAGQEVYSNQCASCHGENLEGVSAPALNSATLFEFSDAAALYDYISQEMPLGAPGSLSETEYRQVEAYVLDQNGLLPSGGPLTPENAAEIELTQ